MIKKFIGVYRKKIGLFLIGGRDKNYSKLGNIPEMSKKPFLGICFEFVQ